MILNQNFKKGNPIEIYASKRTEYFKKNPINSKPLCELLLLELLYMWVCIIYCEEGTLHKMLESKCDFKTELSYDLFLREAFIISSL